MIFTPLRLSGSYRVDLDPIEDDRGFNARVFCEREFAEHNLASRMVQTNVISNRRRGTLRGMHYQAAPMADAKLFRVTRGAIYDVIVDLLPGSPTVGQWEAIEIRAGGGMLYVPAGFGQGFQCLEDDTELTYQVSVAHSPAHGRGFRHDDPAFGIHWPLPITDISDRDRSWPNYEVHR